MSAAPKKKFAWEPCESLSSFLTLHAIVLKTAMAKQTSPWSRCMKIPSWIFGGSTNSQDAHKRFNPKKFEWMCFKNARNATQCHGYRVNWIPLDSIWIPLVQYSICVLRFLPIRISPKGSAKHSDLRRRSRWGGGSDALKWRFGAEMCWTMLEDVEDSWRFRIPVLLFELSGQVSLCQKKVEICWKTVESFQGHNMTQHDTTVQCGAGAASATTGRVTLLGHSSGAFSVQRLGRIWTSSTE